MSRPFQPAFQSLGNITELTLELSRCYPAQISVDEITTPPSSRRHPMPRTPPSKASTSYGFEINGSSSDSDLSDAPEDIGPYPFDSPLPSLSIKSEGNSTYGKDFKTLQEYVGPDPFESPLPSPTIKSRENSEYEEDFNTLREDIRSYSFDSPLPSPTIKSREDWQYEKDFRALQELLPSAKEAFDTTNFSQQVETAAKLDIAMEDFDEKWPGRLPDAGTVSDSGTDSLYQDLSSTDGDNNDSTLAEYFPCPYASVYHCTTIFKVESAAIAHSTIHTAISGKYLCPYAVWKGCPRTFSNLQGARMHGDAVHLGLKPFPCPYAADYACTKSFSQSHSAKEHGYTHTGEKPHPCPYATEYACLKFFSQSHSAKEHGYTHTGEKPHPCPYAAEYGCSKVFSQSNSAKEHGRTHIGKDHDENENKKSMLTQLNHSARSRSGSFATTTS